MTSFVSHLSCSRCDRTHPARELRNLCDCGGPLFVEYDLERVGKEISREDLAGRAPSMWRYRELLPPEDHVVTLGEGFTPLLSAPALGAAIGLPHLWIKEDGLNPTGSFKARGASAGISMARELGVSEVALPTAGNAGSAWAAYGAAAGIAVHVVMPSDAPAANRLQCEAFGAEVRSVEGTIATAAGVVAEGAAEHGWFEVSGMKEPYRVEGKKTFALEIVEQLGWQLPDAIVYPTGGGIGLIGIHRGIEQLLELGWVTGELPRLYAVQAEGCAPVVRAYERGAEDSEPWPDPETIASGLRVPFALGHRPTLRAIRASGGAAVSVPDAEALAAVGTIASRTGILACPEGAAAVAGAARLRREGTLGEADRVVVVNTGSGLLYPEALALASEARAARGKERA